MKKALTVGINRYQMSGNNLLGCINDALRMQSVYHRRGFTRIIGLYDASATKSNILGELEELLLSSKKGDVVSYYHSGHGSQVPDFSGEEIDGLDECIVTYDHDWEDALTDDKLAKVITKLPSGVSMSLILDTCHSGTLTDTAGVKSIPMPSEYQEIAKERALSVNKFGKGLKSESKQRHILFSGCGEGEYSYEIQIGKEHYGLMTHAFVNVDNRYKRNYHSWKTRLRLAKSVMNKFHIKQTPILRAPTKLANQAIFGG